MQAMTSDRWCPRGVRKGGTVLPFFSRKLEMYLMYKYKICLKCVQVQEEVGVHLKPPCLALFEKEAPPNVLAHQMQQTDAVGDCARLFVMECVLYILT